MFIRVHLWLRFGLLGWLEFTLLSDPNTDPSAWSRSAIESLVRRTVYDRLDVTPSCSSCSTAQEVAPPPRLVVNISARHAHVSSEALGILFGEGAELTVQKPLYQEGAFSSEQEVAIFGPRRQTIANLRILGPLRDACQVELSFSDARFLGIDAPVRLSGDHHNTPGCYLVGPAGGLQLSQGVIRAARHAHMNPLEATAYGVSDGGRMRLVVDSEQGGTLENIICRVGDRDRLEVHLDTDEGNAVDLVHARRAHLESQ